MSRKLIFQLGLTNPNPDVTFGFANPANPPRNAIQLSNADIALIKMAESLRHPFLVVENKSAQGPIEEAENQAIRSGCSISEIYFLSYCVGGSTI